MRKKRNIIKLFSLFICVIIVTGCDDKKNYNIVFNTDGGTYVPSQLIKSNLTAKRPSDPIKQGYTFVGWEKNYVSYNFNNKVKSDFVLVAKWQKNGNTATTKPITTVKPTQTANNENRPQIKAIADKKIIYKKANIDTKTFFIIDFGSSSGKTVCKIDNSITNDTENLAVGNYLLICTATANNNLSSSASINIEVKDNVKTEVIKLTGSTPNLTKTIEVADLDSIQSYNINDGKVDVVRENNKIIIKASDKKNPSCVKTEGYQQTTSYSDGSTCSKYYIYTYVNGVITDVKCYENKCNQRVTSINDYFKNYYLDSSSTSGCSCENQSVLNNMIGINTNNGLNTAVKIGGNETYQCVYKAPTNYIPEQTTCIYDYTVTITYKLK